MGSPTILGSNGMKIFVISMLNSTERRKSITQELVRLGLEFEFIDAVVGKDLSEDEINRLCDVQAIQLRPEYLTRGVIGDALSHWKAYGRILRENISCALILEDDMLLPDDTPEMLEQMPKIIRDNEAILLYYRKYHTVHLSRQNSRKLTNKYSVYAPLNKAHLLGTTGGYVISRNACESLLKILLPIRLAADEWETFMGLGGLERQSVVFPRPLICANFQTTIDHVSLRSKMVDKLRVPILYGRLKRMREFHENRMSSFEIVDQVSEFDA